MRGLTKTLSLSIDGWPTISVYPFNGGINKRGLKEEKKGGGNRHAGESRIVFCCATFLSAVPSDHKLTVPAVVCHEIFRMPIGDVGKV